MKVILNSDVLYANFWLDDRLPRHIEELCEACRDQEVPIVLPETTVLEFNTGQMGHVNRERRSLESAYSLLEKHGIEFERRAPEQMFPAVNLREAMKANGATIEVAASTPEEFREAHRRTCLREAPHPPNPDANNEMRDILIWCVALRVAREEGGAILLSEDNVHTHERGHEEADEAGLRRCDDVDQVMEALQVETPSGALTRSLLAPIWEELVSQGLPGGRPLELRGVDAPIFVLADKGYKRAEAYIRTSGPRIGEEMTGRVEFRFCEGDIAEANVSQVKVNGESREEVSVELDSPRSVEDEFRDYDERYEALIGSLEGGSSGS